MAPGNEELRVAEQRGMARTARRAVSPFCMPPPAKELLVALTFLTGPTHLFSDQISSLKTSPSLHSESCYVKDFQEVFWSRRTPPTHRAMSSSFRGRVSSWVQVCGG